MVNTQEDSYSSLFDPLAEAYDAWFEGEGKPIFYSYEEVEKLLNDSGFTVERCVATLFQKPGAVEELETPKDGFSAEAGFTIITGRKTPE